MTRRRIAIATAGRFHVLDLARELAALGEDVTLYSMLPGSRAASFGLPARCHVSLLPLVAPIVAWQRFAPRLAPEARSRIEGRAFDAAVRAVLKPCDVFIFMSGIYLEAARFARRKFGAQLWLERGSRHILSQAEILTMLPGARQPFAGNMRRELEGYELADRIVVPSRHVEESFARDPAAAAKLFVNSYGADLGMFPAIDRTPAAGRPLGLVMAGSWSRRKGCDVLAEAIKSAADVRLTHLGPIGDLPFPEGDPRFVHLDPVPQRELARHYAMADALVLASREEGLSTVLAQALATGLPILCTDRTGGIDLAHTPALKRRIIEVPHGDASALRSGLEALRAQLRTHAGLAPLAPADRETLSWTAYARRYQAELGRSASDIGAIVSTTRTKAPQ